MRATRSAVVGAGLVVAASGCTSAPRADETAARGDDVVKPTSPVESPGAIGAIPPLARQHGRIAIGAPNDTSALVGHEAVFTDGTDLPSAPAFTSSAPWVADATSDVYAASPALAPRLGEALTDASNEMSKLDAATLTGILSVLSYLPGVQTSARPPATQFYGYDAESARWLRSIARVRPLHTRVTTYADPYAFAAHRERAARLYCAAREAENVHQSASTKSMGKQSAFSFTLFGQRVDVLGVEPTVVLDGPGPFIGLSPRCPIAEGCAPGAAPDDGAQAFTVPFLFGVQITPISFLPSLAEVRYPVVMVSGDTEVETDVARAGGSRDVAKRYRTATHTDALVTEGLSGGASAQFPIAEIGPVEIDLGFDLNMGIGQPASGTTTACGLSFAGSPTNDRGLVPPSPNGPPAWPAQVRGGYVSSALDYADGAWILGAGTPASYDASTMSLYPFRVASSVAGQVRSGTLASFDPFLVRALEDDDRVASSATSLSLDAKVIGALAGPIGPLLVDLSATGELCGAVGLRHTLRDAVITEGGGAAALVAQPAFPLSAVTIAPSTYAGASLSFDVHLTIQLDVLFGTITLVDADLVKATLPLAQYDTLSDPTRDPWSEASKLRLGTGSSFGAAMTDPFVLSHFPERGPFLSFPPSVTACLANPNANKPPPPACTSAPPAASGPVQTDVCIFNEVAHPAELNPGTAGMPPLPPDPCANIAAYVAQIGGNAAQEQCTRDYLAFLCSPVSQAQTFEGDLVVARELLTSDASTNAATAGQLQSVVAECVAANVPPSANVNLQGAASAYAQTLFAYGFCDASANLLPPNQVVAGPSDPTAPPAVSPGTCH